MDTGLSQTSRENVRGALIKLLADTYAVYIKTQKLHWNVVGREFYSLHILLEKQYEDLAEVIDETAERIRALGFTVQATFSHFKQSTSIPEEAEDISTTDMIKLLIESHDTILRNGRHLSILAEKEKDYATVDMMGKRLAMHEKFAWMLRSSV